MTKQKYIFCLLEAALGLWFLVMAGLSFYDARNEIKRLQVESVNAKLQKNLTIMFKVIGSP